MTLSLQLLWNYWSIYHGTWYVDRTSYGVMHIGRKFWSPHFCRSYAPWNLENIRKSTNNLRFLCQFFINEITASDAGLDIIRSHLFQKDPVLRVSVQPSSKCPNTGCDPCSKEDQSGRDPHPPHPFYYNCTLHTFFRQHNLTSKQGSTILYMYCKIMDFKQN